MENVSIRHADPDALNQPTVPGSETSEALHEWWDRWDTPPATRRDRPAAAVLAEQRNPT